MAWLKLVRETLLRWVAISLKIIALFLIMGIGTLLIVWVFGLDEDHEGPIPTPYFPDQVTPSPSG